MEPVRDKARLVSTRWWIPKNWISGWTLQPSIEPVVTSSSVPSDFLVEGQVSRHLTVLCPSTLNFISTWFLPLYMKRKTLLSLMGGFQKRMEEYCGSILNRWLLIIDLGRLTKERVTMDKVTKERVTKERVTKEGVTKKKVTMEGVTKE